jgi:hypothetical protein
MERKYMKDFETLKRNGIRLHRDGTVSYWDVYCQQWQYGVAAEDIPDQIWASWWPRDRARVERATGFVPSRGE